MPKPTLPVPGDFPLYASAEGNLKLRKRYSVGGATIERWRMEIDAPPVSLKKLPRPLKRAPRFYVQPMRDLSDELEDGFDLDRCLRNGGYGDC